MKYPWLRGGERDAKKQSNCTAHDGDAVFGGCCCHAGTGWMEKNALDCGSKIGRWKRDRKILDNG